LKIFSLLQKISFRDVLLVLGLCLMGYGLYLFAPWLSFTVCGVLIFAGGFFMADE